MIQRAATMAWGGRLRLTLTRRWNDGPSVCFIGHNPSTADHEVDDPTVRRWMHFARAWGYGGFVAVNLYPIRTANAAKARQWAAWEHNGPDWYARDAIFYTNLPVIQREAKAAGLVVACWGAIAKDDDYVEHVVDQITSEEAPWPAIHAFGKTKKGSPIHPMARGKLRVSDDTMPMPWRQPWT